MNPFIIVFHRSVDSTIVFYKGREIATKAFGNFVSFKLEYTCARFSVTEIRRLDVLNKDTDTQQCLEISHDHLLLHPFQFIVQSPTAQQYATYTIENAVLTKPRVSHQSHVYFLDVNLSLFLSSVT
jgi:hypothetical protein